LADRETVIAAWLVELAGARKRHQAHENLVKEYEKTLNDALQGLEALRGDVERLTSELSTSQTKLAVSKAYQDTLCAELQAAQAGEK
jgi:peptidoglycan hydrolase CwlO-like protein